MASAVLLIDDNAVQAGIRQTILRRAGHHVLTALSAERVMEQFRAHDLPETIGLVITDHVMPGMDGATFIRQLRLMEPKVPVLVITGMSEAEKEYEGLQVTFRTKPLPPESLLETVQALLHQQETK